MAFNRRSPLTFAINGPLCAASCPAAGRDIVRLCRGQRIVALRMNQISDEQHCEKNSPTHSRDGSTQYAA
jgi:hypothetical protein